MSRQAPCSASGIQCFPSQPFLMPLVYQRRGLKDESLINPTTPTSVHPKRQRVIPAGVLVLNRQASPMRGLRILLLAAALLGCCRAEQPASNADLVLSPGEEPIALTGLAVHPEYAACAASPIACTKLEVIPFQGVEPVPVEGTIPTEIGLLSNIQRLSLYNAKVNGTLPTELGMLTALTTLSIHNNHIDGQLPSELGMCTGLRHIFAYKNKLSGTLPTTLGNLTMMESFFVSSNKFHGPVPSELGNMRHAIQFSLHNNSFDGSVPSELGQLYNLNAFYLSDNQLTGVIPEEVMAQLVYAPQWSVCDNEVLSTNMTNTRVVADSDTGLETNETFQVCKNQDLYTSAAPACSFTPALLLAALMALLATM